MIKVFTLNNISPIGLEKLPRKDYGIASKMSNFGVILVRSAKNV